MILLTQRLAQSSSRYDGTPFTQTLFITTKFRSTSLSNRGHLLRKRKIMDSDDNC